MEGHRARQLELSVDRAVIDRDAAMEREVEEGVRIATLGREE